MVNVAGMVTSPVKARIAIGVYFFVSGFGFSTWASRIPAIQQHLQLNEAQLGGVLFALPVGLLMTLPVTGLLLSRFSSRNIMITGAVLFNLMLGVIGFASHTWQLLVALFCFGSSRNLMNISMNAQSIGVQQLYDRPIITTFHGVWSLAGFAGAATGSLMVSGGIAPAYHFTVVGLLLTACVFYAFPNSLPLLPSAKDRRKGFTLPDASLMKFGLISFASMACEGTMYDWSGIYFQKAVHASSGMVTVGFAVYMVAMTAGRLTGDRLVSRVGIKNMLTCSGLLISAGLLLAAIFPFPFFAGFGFMMVGFGVSCVIPLVFSMAGKSKSLGSGPAIAAVSTIGYLGFLIVPPVVGYIAQMASLRWSFALIAVIGASITWMVTGLKEV